MSATLVRCVAAASFALASLALPVRAQEVTNEQSEVRHIYDAAPVWETDADATVQLRAPADLTICRQGRVVPRGGFREVHMGCWSLRADGFRLGVPSGPAFLAFRSGLDLSWIGGGPLMLRAGDVLEVHLDDRLAVRVVGWVVLGLAAITTAIGAIGLGTRAFASDNANIVLTAVGGATLFVGLALALLGDGVQIAVADPPSTAQP